MWQLQREAQWGVRKEACKVGGVEGGEGRGQRAEGGGACCVRSHAGLAQDMVLVNYDVA